MLIQTNQTNWAVISSCIVAWIGLLLSAYNIYAQRRDRKPKLKISSELTVRNIKLRQDSLKSAFYEADNCFVLTIKNPSDRNIIVNKVCFISSNKHSLIVKPKPKPPQTVPSHDSIELVMASDNLSSEFHDNMLIGRFQIEDALGNVFSTEKRSYKLPEPVDNPI